MKRFYFCAILILSVVLAMAQTLTETREFNVIPPAPDVASLLKFSETPVSPFTGQPNINIPIYTLREGSLSVPISIRYHGGGIKISEASGVVGSGWSLDAGGCISRTVYGLADEINSSVTQGLKGVFHLDDVTKALRDSVFGKYIPYGYVIGDAYADGMLPISICRFYNEGIRDVANDIFNINCMGISGVFAYEPNTGKKILSTPSAIKFDNENIFNGVLPIEYSIKDDKGTLYVFGSETAIDTTTSYHRHPYTINEFPDSVKTISAWHLSKLINITGDTIEFSYIKGRRRSVSLGVTQNLYIEDGTPNSYRVNTSASSASYIPSLISEIKTRTIIAQFKYSDDTETLTEIKILTNGLQPVLLQKYVFNHSSIPVASKMLKLLTEINQISPSNGNSSIKLYKFNYNSGNTASVNPYLAIDQWGYYNGIDNTSIVQSNTSAIVPYLGDRTARETYAKCGILTSINYPTGGSAEFTWEQNDYSYIKNSRLQPYTIRDTTVRVERISGKNTSVDIVSVNQLPPVTMEIEINGSTLLEIDMSKYMAEGMVDVLMWDEYKRTHYHYDYIERDMENYPRFEIRNSDDDLLFYKFIDESQCSTLHTKGLEPGRYKLRIVNPVGFYCDSCNGANVNSINGFFGNSADSNGDYGYISVKITETSESYSSYTKPWGGLRIAEISYIADNALPITKQYYYKDGDINSHYSSGTIGEVPYYQSVMYRIATVSEGHVADFDNDFTKRIGFHSSGLYSTPNGGSHIEYPEVWEQYEGDSLIVRYDSQRQTPDVAQASFYDYISGGSRMNTSKAHFRGNLITKSYYKGDKIYRCEINNYDIIEDENTPNFCGDFTRVLNVDRLYNHTPTGEQVSSDYTTCIYKIIPYRKHLMSTQNFEYINGTYTTDYYEDPFDYTDSVAYTYFDDSSSLMSQVLRSKMTKNSLGEIETTYYSYLKASDNSYVSLPQTEVMVCNGKIISGKRMEYDQNNRLKATYLAPSGISAESQFHLGLNYGTTEALLDIIDIPEYTYRYDSNGNIIEISYDGIPMAAYLWSYQGSHPVAEIRGIGYDEMTEMLPANLRPSTLSDRCDVTESELNTLRSIFPDKDVITITHHWFVGVTSLTDSRGIVTRYNYDEFGRLDNVKDYNNYFIKKFVYNYVN